jgi:hypothetical protein
MWTTDRGYHLWVFPREPLIPAIDMRRALTAACAAVGYDPKEVFPKQVKVVYKGLGNFVRLPYNGHYADPKGHRPRRFLEHEGPLLELLEDMERYRTPGTVLAEVAALSPEPLPVAVSVDVEADTDLEEVVQRLPRTAHLIWRDGPLPGSDRSTVLVHLARLCAETELPPDETFAVLASADRRWGKDFLDRGEAGVAILQRIITKAYA